jgi:cytochrome b subunit of formate dehydrogenase/nitrate/TMAO reductase-like tetraheme cytochrome c subunit
LLLAMGLTFAWGSQAQTAPAAPAQAAPISNAACLDCHQTGKKEIQVPGRKGEDGKAAERALLQINPKDVAKGVHAKVNCVACHTGITDTKAPHQKAANFKMPECADCHTELWKKRQEDIKKPDFKSDRDSRLGVVVDNIESYKKSFHARKNDENPSGVNATCTECHNTHTFNVPPRGAKGRTAWHMSVPNVCGNCHDDQLETYSGSVHGIEVLKMGNKRAAVCTDCHTTHDVGSTSSDQVRLLITQSCGDCHEKMYQTYRQTYHGQVNNLGDTRTAKCFDCHGSHEITRVDDPDSKVSPENVLATCKECHSSKKAGMHDATPGFATFAPHGDPWDFKKYPEMYIVNVLYWGLIILVYIFFWTHTALWWYRELKERREHKAGKPKEQFIDTRGMNLPKEAEHKYVRRFSGIWRLSHLLFALAVMGLVATGSILAFSSSVWAALFSKILGGVPAAGAIHRFLGYSYLIIFALSTLYMMWKLLRDNKFKWFGPDSLMPTWQDKADLTAMLRWFVGKGPRPQLDRWTYFMKFDFWALFWGTAIIGVTGLVMAYPHVAGAYLPGWVFNVSMLIHNFEALALCAVFIFTVHFFTNHFRPDKWPPPNLVMFTGSMSQEEFQADHPMHYKRLVESGELQKYLVDPPSPGFRGAAWLLGVALLMIGLLMLFMILVGSL